MPLCTPADVKLAARLDADITAHDAEIPHLIAAATEEIEQQCNVPSGWFEQSPAPRGWAAARRCCIALAALRVDDPGMDGSALLSSSMLWAARYHGAMPLLIIDPVAAYMASDYVAAGYVAAA